MALLLLRPVVQAYAWGQRGRASVVAQLVEHAGVAIDDAAPYAELWMGTHPSGPATIVGGPYEGQQLGEVLGRQPARLLTAEIAREYGARLPFLLKVLSVRTALSIQAHPDKPLAARLHAADPEHYPDDNHKPEMAIAITPFVGLCGFRPLGEIAQHLASHPEFCALVGESEAADFAEVASRTPPDAATMRSHLRRLFEAFIMADEQRAAACCSAIVERLERAELASALADGSTERVVLELCRQYPGDCGIFAPFFLNVVRLAPGQAMFLAANEPHAYLSGDCVECMAESDNVVRAGLTPKYRDKRSLVDMLTYTSGPGRERVLEGDVAGESEGGGRVVLYRPPVPEFAVARLHALGAATIPLQAVCGPSVAIVVAGSGAARMDDGASIALERGVAFFLEPRASGMLDCGARGIDLYRAYCELLAASAND